MKTFKELLESVTDSDFKTVKKETNWYHPDMHDWLHGETQDSISKDHERRMKKRGITAVHHRVTGNDGKTYITHISYTGPAKKVDKAVKDHAEIEDEHKEAMGDEDYADEIKARKKVLRGAVKL